MWSYETDSSSTIGQTAPTVGQMIQLPLKDIV